MNEDDLYPTPCPVCDGSGVQVHGCRTYEVGCGYAHDDSYETPCQECDGTGQVLVLYEEPDERDNPANINYAWSQGVEVER